MCSAEFPMPVLQEGVLAPHLVLPQCCGSANVEFVLFIPFFIQFVGLAELPVAKGSQGFTAASSYLCK